MGWDDIYRTTRYALRDLWTWLSSNIGDHYLLAACLVAVALVLWKMLKPPA
jgi:hypothetical protein